jgi:quinol monooxygenase YgiN
VQTSNPNHVFFYEVYDNVAARAARHNTDRFKKFAAITANMVTGRNIRPMSAVTLNAKAH